MKLRAHRPQARSLVDGYDHIGENDPLDKNALGTINVTSVDADGIFNATSIGSLKGSNISHTLLVKKFALYFLTGLSGLVLAIAIIYFLVLICRYILWDQSIENEDGSAEKESYLARMTPEERRAVIGKILVARPYSYFIAEKAEALLVRTEGDPTEKVDDETEYPSDTFGSECTSVCHDKDEEAAAISTAYSNDSLGATTHLYQCDSESHVACSICIEEYQANDVVVTGKGCIHMFHKDCALEWLARCYVCPCCRKEMISEVEMLQVAPEVLGVGRMKELMGENKMEDDID